MNTEEHDELWQLLGKAKQPQPSPFFARNVLRAIREEKPAPVSVFDWLRRRWASAALASAAVALLAVAFIPSDEQPQSDTLLLAAEEVSASPDYAVISNLDELLDSERNSVWLEASAF
jgi:hypothetical protein